MTNRQLVDTWMQKVWWEQDAQAISQMFRPDGTAEGLGSHMVGPEDFKVFHGQLLKLIDKVKINVAKEFTQGSWSAFLCTMECVAKKDPQNKIVISGTIFARIENDCIVEAYNHFDFMALYEQLGLLPPDTFAKCLSGDGISESVV